MSLTVYFHSSVPVKVITLSFETNRGWIAHTRNDEYEIESERTTSPVAALEALLKLTSFTDRSN